MFDLPIFYASTVGTFAGLIFAYAVVVGIPALLASLLTPSELVPPKKRRKRRTSAEVAEAKMKVRASEALTPPAPTRIPRASKGHTALDGSTGHSDAVERINA